MKDLKLSLIIAAIDKATSVTKKIGGAIGGLENRVHRFNSAFKKIGVGEVLGAAAIIGGVTMAAKGILDLTNKTADLGEEFLHSAKKAGISVEAWQRLAFAGKQLGIQDEDLGHGIFFLQRQMIDALTGKKEPQRAFRALHIPLGDLKGLTRDPEKALMRVADAFSHVTNPAMRAKLAMDIFSRAGVRMLPFLLAGSDEIRRLEAQIVEAHGVLTQKDAESAEQYVQAKRKMGVAVLGLEMQVGNRLIPTLTTAIDKVTAWSEHLSPLAIHRFTGGIARLVEKLPELMPKFERLLELATKLATQLLNLGANANFLKGALVVLAAFMGAQFLVVMVEAVGAIATIGGALLALVGPAFAASVALLGVDIPILLILAAIALVAGAVYLVVANWKSITGFFSGLWNKVGQVFTRALKWIEKNTPIGWLYDRWNGIIPYFAGLFGKLENVFTTAWKRIEAATPDWLKTVLKVGAMAAFPVMPGVAAAAAISLAHPGPARAMGAHPAAAGGKVAVHVHVTADGKPQVKSVTASGAATASVSRGVLPG